MHLSPATVETKRVYRAIDGRHYFTKHAAMVHSAWVMIKTKCICESWLDDLTGTGCADVCQYHAIGPAGEPAFYGHRVVERLVRLWKRRGKTCA